MPKISSINISIAKNTLNQYIYIFVLGYKYFYMIKKNIGTFVSSTFSSNYTFNIPLLHISYKDLFIITRTFFIIITTKDISSYLYFLVLTYTFSIIQTLVLRI